jgi:hypothetical protein
MTDPRPRRPLSTPLERLEGRELLSGSPWLVEAFQRGPADGLPQGWAQWSADGSKDFAVSTAGGLGDSGQLVTSGPTGVPARAWVSNAYSADLEVSAAVFLNATASAYLFARGQNLATATPSYYAVNVVRGAEIQLVRVDRGVETVLARARTPDYLSNRWVTVTLRADGDGLKVFFHRGDTNQYLTGDGGYTRQPTAALEVTDKAIRGGGQVGFARGSQNASELTFDSLRVGPAASLSATPLAEERFERPSPGLPAGWSQWSGPGKFTATTVTDETLRLDAASATQGRAWLSRTLPADVQVSSSIYVDSLVPTGLIARGSNLAGTRETGYGLSLTRGLEVKLTRTVGGNEVTLARLKSNDYLSGLWVQASLVLNGDQLRAQVYRSDTGQYLNADGSWGLLPAWAMSVTDNAIKSGSFAGLTRGTGYAGTVAFDNFIVTTAPPRSARPGPIPTEFDKPTTPATPGEDLPRPPTVPPVTPPRVPPVTPPVSPPPAPAPAPTGNSKLPDVDRNYSHIRLANLAYYGTPLDNAFAQKLLAKSIDLVIPNTAYLDTVAAANPDTPQFVYTNVSNVYLDLLADWDAYADAHNLSREGAFYHAATATPFKGASASSVPVNQFWGVYRTAGAASAAWDDLTRDASNARRTTIALPAAAGGSLALGNLEKFREVNVDIAAAARAGWSGTWEYVSAADAAGNPTRWSTLNLLADGTGGMKRDGRLTFDPPRDWVTASVGGSDRLYYVRLKSAGTGTAPTVKSVLGRDYTAGGVTPAFDTSADRNGDGYLSDAEYARRKPGFDARFVYESRINYPNYGPQRYATNVADPGFRAWAADYATRFLKTQPKADGFFVDNSIGRLILDPATIRESLDNYSADYGSLLGGIDRTLRQSGKWLVANTAGGSGTSDPVFANGVSSLEEFALRPASANHVQYDDLVATLKYRRQLADGRAYEILDSLPGNGFDATDPRLQLATLAMYYTIADPDLSFLMVNGGNEPASSWTRHWIPAATFNVGKPKGEESLFATGTDPANRSLVYKVYGRQYDNALVLYKPLSYTRGVNGTTANNTATAHQLDGLYRPLKADGTLGAATRTVTLRNGEGAVLVRA